MIAACSKFRVAIASSSCPFRSVRIISCSFLVIRLSLLVVPLACNQLNDCVRSASDFTTSIFLTFELAMVGVILCAVLNAVCTALRRCVSRNDLTIDSVNISPYNMTSPRGLRAARPMIWINDVVLRKNHSLSASKIATNDTSGRSIPSLRRLTQTKISI